MNNPAVGTSGDLGKRKVISQSRRAALTLPKVKALGVIGVGVTGVELGWKLGNYLNGADWWVSLLGQGGAPSPPNSYSSHELRFFEAAGYTTYGGPSEQRPSNVWQVRVGGNDEYCVDEGGGPAAVPAQCKTYSWQSEFREKAVNDYMAALYNQGGFVSVKVADSYCGVSSDFDCRILYRTEARVEAEMYTGAPAAYTGPGTGQPVDATTTYTRPAPTTADRQAVGAVMLPATQTAAEQAAENEVNEALQPGWAPPPETFVIPAPTRNETYSAYLSRLQALGHVGSSSTVAESSELAGYGPSSPTRVVVPGTTAGTTRILDPLRWPNPAPTLAKDASVTVRYNPSTAPPVAEGGGGGGVVGGETGAECTVPAIDFGPLSVGATTKFPFGLFAWVTGFFAQFSNTAERPSFALSRPPGMAAGPDFVFEAPDYTYKTLTDGIAKFIIVVSSVYFGLTWAIGWGRRGDSLND
jgi:hypothetical protein